MAGRGDFTPDEWFTMQRGIIGAAIMVSIAEGGFVEGVREMVTLYHDLDTARTEGGCQLVRELANVDGFDSGFKPRTAPARVEGPALEALRSAAAILGAKAPGDLQAYRDFVYHLAYRVAATARGVSDVEKAAIAKINQATGNPGGR